MRRAQQPAAGGSPDLLRMLAMAAAVMLTALAACLGGSRAAHAHAHRAPTAPPPELLLPPRLQRLGCGATKPAGWLKDELTLQARGISGQLPYFWEYFNKSAWMGEKGRDPQQFLPYYLQGMIPLSYQVDDSNLEALREEYIDFILANQSGRTDGWLGPPVKSSDPHEYWSKYDMIEALEYFAEAEPSRGAEIKASLVRHHAALFRALKTNAPDFNQSRWGVDRYSDGLVGIQWLLDQGEGGKPGGSFLWELLRLLRSKADSLMAARDHSWERWFDSDPGFTTGSTSPFNYTARAAASGGQGDKTGFVHLLRHGVDIGQAMKTGPLWWRVDGQERDWENGQASVEWAEAYLHRADGMYFADEEVQGEITLMEVLWCNVACGVETARLTGMYLCRACSCQDYTGGGVSGDHTPSRGTETCSVVETMFSMRAVYEVTGNVRQAHAIGFAMCMPRHTGRCRLAGCQPAMLARRVCVRVSSATSYHMCACRSPSWTGSRPLPSTRCRRRCGPTPPRTSTTTRTTRSRPERVVRTRTTSTSVARPMCTKGVYTVRLPAPRTRPHRTSAVFESFSTAGFGSWPKFVFSAVHTQAAEASEEGDDDTATIVISGYAPTVSTIGQTTVTVSGDYPFSDSAKIHLGSSAGAAAAAAAAVTPRNLRLRVPCWSEGATITLGNESKLSAPSCSFANVSVAIGATLTIAFDNKIKLHEWKPSSLDGQSQIAGGGIEVHRGALTYALRPRSTITSGKPGGVVQPYPQSLPGGARAVGGWANISHRQVTIAPNASWNYGIYVDSLTFEEADSRAGGGAIPAVPFDVDAPPPVYIRAKARRVPVRLAVHMGPPLCAGSCSHAEILWRGWCRGGINRAADACFFS
jgi:hypothetical protein